MKHENFYELRFLLHGLEEKYDSDKCLYITSQETLLWEKVARKIIEQWRIIPTSLAEIIPAYLWSQLNIQAIIPKTIIAELSPHSLTAEDLPLAEDREELLGQILLNNRELWKKLPLHKTIDGKFVSIDNQTYLENPNFKCDSKLKDITTLIKSNPESQQNLIDLWIPETAIAVILKQEKPEQFCSLLLNLIEQTSDESLLQRLKQSKWLPLTSGGVTSPENIIIVPNKQLSEKLEHKLGKLFCNGNSSYVTLSMLVIDKNYCDLLKKICLKKNHWYENNILEFLLNETYQPDTHCQFIIETLKICINRNQSISNENIQTLGNKLWLVDSKGRAISPCKIINFPALKNDFTDILKQLESWEYVTPVMLGNGIDINFCFEHNQLQILFATNHDALEAIGNAVNQLPNYYIGDFDIKSFPLNEFIQVLKSFTELPAIALKEKISEQDFQQYILPNVLKPLVNYEKLIKILQWIAETHTKVSENNILVYNKYLELACREAQDFGKTILPQIQLLNQNNQWKSPNQLCDGNKYTGINTEHILSNQQRQILSCYLDNLTSSISTLQQVDISCVNVTNESNAQVLKEYFDPWLSYVNSEAIGAFLCLLSGTNIEVQKLAEIYLRRRDFNDLRERLLWSSFRERNVKISVLPLDSNSIDINNLFGILLKVSKSLCDLPNHLFVGDLTQNSIEIKLISISIKEFTATRLKEILLESVKMLIERVHGTQTNNEPLNEIWKDLDASTQLDIEAARYFILKNLHYILRSLKVNNCQIHEYLEKWDDEEYKLTNKKIRNLNTNNIEQEIENIINSLKETIYNTASVQQNILDAVRQQIGQGQSGYKPSSIPFELFQNADDAISELKTMYGDTLESDRLIYILDWNTQCLRIMHWGRPINCFTHPNISDKNFRAQGFERDLIKMLSFNISDKSEDKTGKFGLGFKTVHLISKEPIVISGDLCFSIRAGLLPFALCERNHEENLELEKQLRNKLQNEQPSTNITDGTLINLEIDPDVVTDINEIVSEFEEKVSLLLIFSKSIRTCKFIVNYEHKQSFTWNPTNVLGIPGIEFGQVKILEVKQNPQEWVTHNLLCFRIKGATVAIALPKNFANKTSPLSKFPTFWVTAPTKETLGLRFVVNEMFDVTTGRTSLDRNSARNIELATKIGEGLGEKLCDMFKSSRGNWEALCQNLKIEKTDEYTFWEFLWNVLAIDWLKSNNDYTNEIIRAAFGGEYCSMGYLIATQAALPNGLYGKVYRQLVCLGNIRYVVDGILANKQYFEEVASWERFQQRYTPHHIVCNTIWQDVEKLLDNSVPSCIDKLEFANALECELGDKRVAPNTANALGKIITRDFLRDLQSIRSHHEERDRIKSQLNDVCFESKDNKQYIAVSQLLVSTKNTGEEEKLLSAFAPNCRLLHKDYIGSSLEFFLTCREQRKTVPIPEMVNWAITADTEEKKQAVRQYLGSGERKQEFTTALRCANIGGTWIKIDNGIKEIFKSNSQQEKVHQAIKGEISWTEVSSSSLNENRDEIAPEITPEITILNLKGTLRQIYTWWQKNHADEIRKYNDLLYPIGIDELRQKLQKEDRSAWLMLFFLGATHMMGRTTHEQHRDFIQFCLDRGWWQRFSAPNPCSHPDEWMGVLNEYMESQSDGTKYYLWMEKFPSIYRIAYYLDAYIQSFLSIDKIKEPFDLYQIFAPRANPDFQGGGPDAAPMRLGIGVNFVVRELVRLGIVEDPNNYIIPHCFVPRANVRRLLSRIGCDGLNSPDYRHSRSIYKFLLDYFNELRLPVPPTFQNAFDIPFQLYSEKFSQTNLLALSEIDIEEDFEFNEDEES